MLRSFVLARLVAPAEYGIWTGVQMIVSLAPIACLGTVETLLKQVPYFRGRQDTGGLKRVEDTVFATMVLAAAITAGSFLLFPWLWPFAFIRENLLLAQMTAAAAGISFFTAFYYHRCTAYEDFKSASIIDSIRSGLGVVFVLGCGWKWGLTGAVFGFLVGEVLSWVVAGRLGARAKRHVGLCFQPSLMVAAVRVGFPITIIWWVYSIQGSVSRMVSLSFLGTTATGYLGVGSSLAMMFALVPNTVGRVFYPRMNAQIGARASLDDLRESVVMPTSAIALLLPVFQLILLFLLPVVYEGFLPKYRAGLVCAQILVFGAFFICLIRNGANYLIASDRQFSLLKYFLVSVAANALGCLTLVHLGFGINGVAVSTSLATALLATLIWKKVFDALGYDRMERLFHLGDFHTSFLAALVAVGLVYWGFSASPPGSLWVPPLEAISALLIWSVLILTFKSTRDRGRDLCRRLLQLFASRFRHANVG